MKLYRMACILCGQRDIRKELSCDGFSFAENWTSNFHHDNVCRKHAMTRVRP